MRESPWSRGPSLVSRVLKMPKVPSVLPFGTFGTGTFTPIGAGPNHVIKEPISKLLPQEMGRGWEWTGDIGKKSMQILLAVRHDLCFPMPFHSAKSAKSVQTTTPSPTMQCHFFYTLALLAQVTAPLAAEAGPTRRLLDVPKWSFLTFYFYFIIISYFILLLFHILLLHIIYI